MNMEYLNALPEAENKYNVNLKENEKVVFATNLPTFGTEKDSMLGSNCDFTLTNQRIIVNNHAGIWTTDIAEDIVSGGKVKGGFLFFKYVYYAVTLREEVIFDYGKQKLSGYRYYFDESDMSRFEEIMDNLLK